MFAIEFGPKIFLFLHRIPGQRAFKCLKIFKLMKPWTIVVGVDKITSSPDAFEFFR
jgi:hypothetical protein